MSPPVITEGRCETARLALHVVRSTPTAPKGRVLLLGGSNFDLRLKRGFLATDLAAHYDIATYEPRGIGRSDQPPGDWSMHDYAADALALLDTLGWARADVLGESFGGMCALHLAQLAPGRVGRITIASATAGGAGGASADIAPFLDMPRADAAKAALILQDRGNADLRATDPDVFAARLMDRIAFEDAFADPSVTSGGYARLLAARAAHDVWDALTDLPHDMLILAGTRDDQAPLRHQRAMADRLPRATFRSFEAGHGLAFTHPPAMKAVMDHWSAHHHEERYV